MTNDLWLLIALAIVAIIDVQLERYSGRGLIARVQDFIERKPS